MQVTVHAQQFELTEGVRRFALETIYDPLVRIFDKQGSNLDIELRDLRGPKGGIDKECRAVLVMAGGPKFVITEVTEDMRKSIHQVRKRLLRRVRAYVTQRIDTSRRHRRHYLADVALGE